MNVQALKSASQNRRVPLFSSLYVSAIALAIGLPQQVAYSLENLSPAKAMPKAQQIAYEKLCGYPIPATVPLDLTPTNPNVVSAANGVVTANTISQYGLTNPSLWWAAEQFGGKLLENWLAYPTVGEQSGRVDLIVNRQFWSLLNYLERYQFVNKLGLVVRDQDESYNLRVFNRQGDFLAAYTCAGESGSSVCNVCLDSAGKAGSLGGN